MSPTQAANKGEAERRETHVLTARCGRRRALGARSPLGVPLRLSPGRQLVPRLCTRPCFKRQSGAFDPVRPPQPGGGDLALLHGRYPRRKRKSCPRPVSISHTGHSAGRMMPDAARERVTNPPAGTALASSQGVSSRRTSLRWASGGAFTRRAQAVKEFIPGLPAL